MPHTLTAPSNITILGAGLIGRLLALDLAREGHRVTIFEAKGPHGDGSAARVAAAMLAPLAESPVTDACVVRMGRYSLARWSALVSSLDQHVFFQQTGTLIVWHRQDTAEAARMRGMYENSCRRDDSLPRPQDVDAAQLATLEPALQGRFDQAILLPGEGQLDNRQLLAALLHQLQALGVQLHWHAPRDTTDFQPGHPGQPDLVLDCRGFGAHPQWQALRGVRGEVLRLHAPDITLHHVVRMVHPRYAIYIAPKENHIFMVGATEIESEDMGPASLRSTMELMSAVYTVHPGFAEARVLELLTQCRPTLPDNLPALRWLNDRTLQVNGLYRHGYLISPAVRDAALQMLRTGSTALAEGFDIKVHQS